MSAPIFSGSVPMDGPSISSSSTQHIASLPPRSFLPTSTIELSLKNSIQRDADEQKTRFIDENPTQTVSLLLSPNPFIPSSSPIFSYPSPDNSFVLTFPFSCPPRFKNESRYENELVIHATKVIMWATNRKQPSYSPTHVTMLTNQRKRQEEHKLLLQYSTRQIAEVARKELVTRSSESKYNLVPEDVRPRSIQGIIQPIPVNYDPDQILAHFHFNLGIDHGINFTPLYHNLTKQRLEKWILSFAPNARCSVKLQSIARVRKHGANRNQMLEEKMSGEIQTFVLWMYKTIRERITNYVLYVYNLGILLRIV